MRQVRLALLLAGAVVCGGCFQFSTVIHVNGDGTGTIDERLIFTQAAVAQLRQFSALAGNGQGFEPVSEQQAREGAATLGAGVSYVSSTPINTSDGIGRDIRYAFTDVSQLRLDETPPAPGGLAMGVQLGASSPHVSFNLTRQADGQALLRILVPQLPLLAGDSSRGRSSMPSADQMAMLKPMLIGARVSIDVEPAGRLVRTTSPFVTGQRVTLVDVNVDALLRDDTLLPRLQAARTPDDAKALLTGLDGVKVILDPEITIEFTPSR